MTGSAALYQVAVALVPALLFGGATLQLREQTPQLSPGKSTAIVVGLILAAGVVAEIIAIRGAIDPQINRWEQRYLVVVLTVGTAGLALWLAAPIISNASSGRIVRLGPMQVVVLLLAAAIGGQLAITQTLDRADELERLEKVSDLRTETRRDQRGAEASFVSARARIIRMTGTAPRSLSIAMIRAMRQIDRLVDIPSGSTQATAIDRPARQLGRRNLRLARIGQDVAEVVARHAQTWLANQDPGFSRVRRELFNLGLGQFYSATSELILAKVNSSLVTRALLDVCQEIDGACEQSPGRIHEKAEELQDELDQLAAEAGQP